ncbi:glycosyltransferase, MGT family protein [Chondrocystis sp. NIES-4102]|nr:glycosyltransferase, MGT family protein [Chondrocystis sp. NIES-4102]
MKHFGILCPPSPGHLNPMASLGYELQRRGHRVTLIGLLDTQPYATAAKIDFCPIGPDKFPLGSTKESLDRLGKLSGIPALLYTIDLFRQGTKALLGEVPRSCREIGIEVLLIDQVLFEGSTIAEYLNIPFITICNAIIVNPEPAVPPALTGWDYDPSWLGQLRNQIGSGLLQLAATPIRAIVEEYRQKWNLPVIDTSNKLNLWSKLAIISQQSPSFEFPRQELPDYFHFTGALINPLSRVDVPFPWEKLTDKPLIYASLGTLQNKLFNIFIQIAYACQYLNVQLVISLGGASEPEELGYLPGSPIVVKVAPQLSLLERARLCITHAGMNTTLESLKNGVPMVAIPITNDQPGVAARIAWTKTGEVVPLNQCNVDNLATAIQKVLTQPYYRQNAQKFQAEMVQAGGVGKAAEIIESVI